MTTTVFRGGALFDGHRHHPPPEGDGVVVVREGRVLAVGAYDGPVDRVVDVAGGLLAPGFVDAHVHAVQGGLERIRCDLSGLATREEYLDAVGAYAAAHPELPWVLGGGWSMSAFPGGTPTAADLDLVVPDRPVLLPNRDHHGAWVNSRALALAGIDRDTPDPPHGRVERDHDGRPTGTLHEGAMHALDPFLPATTPAELDAALAAGQAHLLSVGVTGWQDAIVGDYAGMADPGPAYRRAALAGTLLGHVVGALWWDRERGVEQVAELVARREELTHGRFRATSVKVMQDGIVENGSAALGSPYLDRCGHATADAGHSFLDPDALTRCVAAAAGAGFQVHVHAIGDRGVRETLDAFEALGGGDAADLRHHVAHLQLVHPSDVARFARLGVAANIQALWACLEEQMTELTLPVLGAERGRWQYPFGELHRSGARLVAGSDWPVSSPDPLQAIHVAVNRRAPGTTGPRFLPTQALALETAFAAATSGSAWVNHRDRAGVVRPGAEADLVVLDRDPFAGDPDAVADARVISTWIGGVPVYEA